MGHESLIPVLKTSTGTLTRSPVTGGEAKLLLPNASGLTWLDDQHVLFSEIKTGIHMGLVTASETRGAERNVYFPAEAVGMAHHSYASPDRKSVVAVEMSASGWQRCRLLPLDGSSPGNPIGPEGRCTSAAWSPDGKWVYLTSDAGGSGFHVWRMRYPTGPPSGSRRDQLKKRESQSLLTANP